MIHPLIEASDLNDSLKELLRSKKYSSIGILTDTNTLQHCYPLIEASLGPHFLFTIPPGESEKNLSRAEWLWKQMMDNLMDRSSCLINLGGGVVGDLGGFNASTFKRGIDYIQIPTTLLSMIDASIGGKNGIDFGGMKNLVGTIIQPASVFVYPPFLKTLSHRNLVSGFAELVKHALIEGGELWDWVKACDSIQTLEPNKVFEAARIKVEIVNQDPFEKGIRKYLNLGHSLGHAIESCFLASSSLPSLLHGEAIAAGLYCMLCLSNRLGYMEKGVSNKGKDLILRLFPKIDIPEEYIPKIIERLKFDKKNIGTNLMFTLLKEPGQPILDVHVHKEEAEKALREYCKV